MQDENGNIAGKGLGNILLDEELTTKAGNVSFELSEEEKAALMSLYSINDDMINWWYGDSDESFINMASIVENTLSDQNVGTTNAALTIASSLANFFGVDVDRSASINIDEK